MSSAVLCYGFKVDNVPWEDLEEWWYERQPNEPEIESPFDEAGEYKEGKTKEDADIYWTTIIKWEKEYPLPVEEIKDNYTILAIPSSVVCCCDDVVEIDFSKIARVQLNELQDFCTLAGIEYKPCKLVNLWEN